RTLNISTHAERTRNPKPETRNCFGLMSRPACILMVKAPRAGAVKTRLVPPLSGGQAAALAACFARDAAAGLRRVVPELIVAYDPPEARAALGGLLPPGGVVWLEQRGADLGERLEAAAARAFALGFGPVLLAGTDSPTLPAAYVGRAAASLAAGEADVALGPTEDGGYYLAGLRRPAPGLFQNVSWSTPQALRQTADNASRLGLRVLELPTWYDVDTFSDLSRLRDEIFNDAEARGRAPATHRWLLEHDSLLSALT
ncbi:MAG TPA: TIGR04282 family arsenosugar biosynthesis glycosyltransferase, partial [Pyrinomonadaceae bacterium]|nr:TIGR04282 family arsenosugar biosynthesis glycosyltransferase [Pyrinomonadaceae bacterium]